ncbi:MAG: elongation factor G [Planctomycetes bacterium]|nr:elongation factor G [Planctomycetota bacterium]
MRDIATLRNIGIIAHIDAGKTTTTERILFYSEESHRMGEVDEGTTITDFDPEEAQRGITIYSAAVTCRWKGITINIIDTPGHVDFTAEVERSLRVLDGGVVVFSAVEGVEAQSETVWRQADRYRVPRICFINKMDRIGAGFERTLEEIKRRLKGTPIPLTVPMGSAHELEGVIDLIQQKALYFDPDSKGKDFRAEEISDKHRPMADVWRKKLLESVALLDDDVLSIYMETNDVPAEQIYKLLRTATLAGHVQPTFSGSAKNYVGVQPLLDGVSRYLPSPLDRPPVTGEHPNPKKRDKPQVRQPSVEEPFCGLVFKIQAGPHGDLCFVRVYSGVLKSGSRVLNARTGNKELVNQIWHIQADSKAKIEELEAGDIGGVIGPKEAVTGDTLCDQGRPVLLESITFPETVISMAVEPETSAERKKLEETLARLARQDPTFNTRIDEETGQTIISGMGELHLEVLRNRMLRDSNLNVRVHKPRVSYRETIRSAVEATGEFHRPQAGSPQFCRMTVRLEPHQGEKPIALVNKLKPGDLPAEMVRVLEQSVMDFAHGGGIVGYPLMNVRFVITDVDYRVGETTDVALQAAASDACREALNAADAVLLEPVMKLEVVTPDEFLGNIQADLNARRAIIVSSELRGDLYVVEAEAPLAQMFGYSTQVRSLSQGRASYSMEPLKYAEAPPEVLREMLG